MDTYKKINVVFPSTIDDSLLTFAVIIAKHNNQYVLVKHKKRETLEFPGGKRESNESIDQCAKRELYEETGANRYSISPLTIYGVIEENKKSYGMLYTGEIYDFGLLPPSEIEKVVYMDHLDVSWTYPHIQPYLLDYYLNG